MAELRDSHGLESEFQDLDIDPPGYTSRNPSLRSNASPFNASTQTRSIGNIPPITGPVTLSWTPPVHVTTQLASTGPSSHRRQPVDPVVLDPQPITYTFSQISSSAMILVPPADAADSHVPYHISVNHNVFMPTSYITLIRRGSQRDGDYVGDFEMGIIDQPATVCLRGREVKMKSLLVQAADNNNAFDYLWIWNGTDPRRGLFWDCDGSRAEWACYLNYNRSLLLAAFRPWKAYRKPGERIEEKELKLFPSGRKYFDDILISVLILERKRLTPDTKHKELFSQ